MRVLKIGGNELADDGYLARLATAVFNIISQTSQPVIIVHGGGKAIADLQTKLGLQPRKVDGLRVTDRGSLAAAEMVLSGQINKAIVAALLAAGVDAIGLSGVDGGLLRCQKKQHPIADLGLVGEIDAVRVELLQQVAAMGLTAVLSPISLGHDGQTYNVNADDAASAIAGAMGATQLDFISNVPGVLQDGVVIGGLTAVKTESLIADGTIDGGMIPKVRGALAVVASGVPQARIVNLEGLAKGGTTFITQPSPASK